MINRRTACIVLAAGMSAVVLVALDLPDLSGTWRLNSEQSDDPARVAREGRAAAGGQGGPPRGGGGGGGGRHSGRSGQRPEGRDPGLFEGMTTLVIDHREPRLAITNADGREQVVFTDGRKTEEEHSHGGTTKVRAEWKDGHVQITSKPDNGPKTISAFTVSADRSQLRVTTEVDGERGKFTIHLVYDAASAKAPAPKSPPTELPPEL